MTTEAVYLLLGGAMVVAGGITFAGAGACARLRPTTRRWTLVASLAAYALLLLLRPPPWPTGTVLVFAAGITSGVAIGGTLTSRESLITFLVVVSVVDVISFAAGPTSWIVEGYRDGRSDLLLYLAASLPVEGRLIPLIGAGDIVVLSAIWEAGRRLEYPPLVLAGLLAVALLVALAVGLAVGGIYFLPFAAVVLAPYLHFRRPCLP